MTHGITPVVGLRCFESMAFGHRPNRAEIPFPEVTASNGRAACVLPPRSSRDRLRQLLPNYLHRTSSSSGHKRSISAPTISGSTSFRWVVHACGRSFGPDLLQGIECYLAHFVVAGGLSQGIDRARVLMLPSISAAFRRTAGSGSRCASINGSRAFSPPMRPRVAAACLRTSGSPR